MTSSFVYAGFFSDHIETNTVPSPTVPSDCKLLADDELNTDFNEEYYNDNHLVEDETEAGEFFDGKADFHTTDDLSGLPNSSKSTNKQILQQDIYSADSTKTYIMRDDSQPQTQQSDEYGIMPISDDDYDIDYNSFLWKYGPLNGGLLSGYGVITKDLVSDFMHSGWDKLRSKLDCNISYSELCSDYPDLISDDNLIILKFTKPDGVIEYSFIYSLSDIYLVDYSFDNQIQIINSDKTNFIFCHSYRYYVDDRCRWFSDMFFGKSVGRNSYFSGTGSFGYIQDMFQYCTVVFSGKHDVYINDVKQDVLNEDGFISGGIKGEFEFKEDSKILTYKAWSDKELDKTYDVHLWAMDSPSVPAKINGNEDFPIRDLDNYDSHGLQLSASKSSVQASYELEAVYYYLHQMQGYDDSLESVDGYDFDEFESRENLNFAIAYRENGSSGDWIVCKSYQYNYGDLIENVMGSFTVKKDYVDFPDMDDYLEDYESWEDVALDETGGEGGFYNNVVVLFKWVGRNLMHFGHNFVGFFKWLIDCIPVLWENLTIALYNLVCDLKELALYFVNPKTKSIYAMTCERIPSFSLLVDSFKNNNSSDLPSFTFFGTKFSLNFSDYDIDFSFIRNILTILFYLLFGYFVFKLIFKIFGFGSGGGDED